MLEQAVHTHRVLRVDDRKEQRDSIARLHLGGLENCLEYGVGNLRLECPRQHSMGNRATGYLGIQRA